MQETNLAFAWALSLAVFLSEFTNTKHGQKETAKSHKSESILKHYTDRSEELNL